MLLCLLPGLAGGASFFLQLERSQRGVLLAGAVKAEQINQELADELHTAFVAAAGSKALLLEKANSLHG